ncbi:MAG: HNH endonuclease [Myxococcaceae bacterium]|nr:HNH endonuclease [Myxococcaceae bacterium]
MKMSVSREFLDEFEQVRAALSHKFPNGRFEDVLRECFRITLEVLERKRCGAERKSTRKEEPADVRAEAMGSTERRPTSKQVESYGTVASGRKRSRYIPAAVRREVWKRDGGACAFVSADGRRCGSRHQVEFHHLDPFGMGGPSTVENLSLRCRKHNAWEAVLAYGEDFMDSRVPSSRSEPRASLPEWKCSVH